MGCVIDYSKYRVQLLHDDELPLLASAVLAVHSWSVG